MTRVFSNSITQNCRALLCSCIQCTAQLTQSCIPPTTKYGGAEQNRAGGSNIHSLLYVYIFRRFSSSTEQNKRCPSVELVTLSLSHCVSVSLALSPRPEVSAGRSGVSLSPGSESKHLSSLLRFTSFFPPLLRYLLCRSASPPSLHAETRKKLLEVSEMWSRADLGQWFR